VLLTNFQGWSSLLVSGMYITPRPKLGWVGARWEEIGRAQPRGSKRLLGPEQKELDPAGLCSSVFFVVDTRDLGAEDGRASYFSHIMDAD
jgi:hypothetical protein